MADVVSRAILLVEADPERQVRLARTLSRAGHRVVATSTADGARALVSEWDVDLILVDEDLPGVSGIDVARRLRRESPEVPIVILTDPAMPASSRALVAAGADAAVHKPLALDDLEPWLAAAQQPLAATSAE